MSTVTTSTGSDDSISGSTTDTSRWLAVTEFLDHDQAPVRRFAETTVAGIDNPRERAVKLFYAARDGYWYDPYSSSNEREAFRASNIVNDERSWCVPKSILLTAAARAVGIPSRLGFADVRNHLQSEKLQEKMGTDLFVFHGYSEFLLDGAWVKASAAFNLELCQRFGTRPLDFDGYEDALLHAFDLSGNRHMEYVRMRGTYDEFPYDEMQHAFAEVYPDADFGGAGDAGDAGDAAFDRDAR